LRSRQAACPQVTSNWDGVSQPPPNPIVITVDYGSGCFKDEEGDFFKGSVSIRIYDWGDLIGASRIVMISYNNFSDGRKTISGSVTAILVFNPEGDLVSFRYSGDIRYTNTTGCSLRVVEQGKITYTEPAAPAAKTKFTVTGKGVIFGSFKVSYQMRDLLWDLASDCNYPVGGELRITSVRITSGGRTEKWTFSSDCGRATVAVDGGKPQVVTLPPLEKDDPDDPCD